jgi:Tfp pilus assembly protein PilN
MSQQINLYSTALKAPPQRFGAEVVAAGLAATALVVVATSIWTQFRTHQLQQDMAALRASQTEERQRLSASLASLPSSASQAGALEQQLAQAEAALLQRRAVLDELTRGRLDDHHRRSVLLRRVAQTVPTSVWLTQIDIDDSRLELHGRTLEPESLRPWLAQLAADPILPGQPLAALKIERDTATGTPAPGARDPWLFTMVSQPVLATRTVADASGAVR